MKKYLNKALIYKEWKNAWWILIPMIIMNNKYIAMLNIVNNKGTWIDNNYFIFFGHNNDASFDIANVLFLMCLAFLLMNRNEKNNEFLCYLLFTKKQVLC